MSALVEDPRPFGILMDVTRCSGCAGCVAACAETHGEDLQRALLSVDSLSSDSRLAIEPVGDGRFLRRSCMHCLEPSCVDACLVGGLSKRPDGAVVYDAERCIGCRYCMLACPFHVPRYEWDKSLPLMQKCDLCAERLDDGRQPACVEACPHQALRFGPRDELLKIASERLASRPDLYVPRIWGEDCFGGTSVLLVSDVDLDAEGLRQAVESSIPSLTRPVLHATPVLACSVAVVTGGVRWIVQRRQRLMREAEHASRRGDDA